MFDPVTKFSGLVETVEQFPHPLRQAYCEASSGATAPVHLDLRAISAEVIMEGEAELALVAEPAFARLAKR